MTWRPRFSLRTLAIFTLLCTCGFGLWWRWEPWSLASSYTNDGLLYPQWIPEDERLIVHSNVREPGVFIALDTATGEQVDLPEHFSPESMWWEGAGDGTALLDIEGVPHVMDPDGGVFAFPGAYSGTSAWLGPSGDLVLLVSPDVGASLDVSSRAVPFKHDIWIQNRPSAIWGVAWLPEFWLTVAFAGLFVWSVWRDRCSLRVRPEPTE